ncbi:hypothetical protein [Cardinium endosymbiont of Nabis limbatus]|uniref:hypothetical protein n=1 Tax=Cardinium endosymbiont of Nabis limbatus TaxID=3066217 RepID=UPI003AF38D3D
MNLFRLISRAALHIGNYRRLLVSSLLAYFIGVACSTQVKYGQESHLKKSDTTLVQHKTTKGHECSTKRLISLDKSSIAYNAIVNADKEMAQLALKQPFSSIQVKEGRLDQDLDLAQYYTDLLKLSIYKLTSQENDLSKEFKINPSDDIKIFKMLLNYVHKTQHKKVISDLFKEVNIIHDIIKNKLLDKNCLKIFKLIYNSENRHIKAQRYLRNNEGLTPLYYAIQQYGKKNLDLKVQQNLEQIIQKLWDQPSRFYAKDKTTGNNELHATVIAHSNATSERSKKFLEKVAKKLSSIYSDLDRIKNLINGVNDTNKTPLHIATNLVNLPMCEILCPFTDPSHLYTALELLIKMCCVKDCNPINDEIRKHLFKEYITKVSNGTIDMLVKLYNNNHNKLNKDINCCSLEYFREICDKTKTKENLV